MFPLKTRGALAVFDMVRVAEPNVTDPLKVELPVPKRAMSPPKVILFVKTLVPDEEMAPPLRFNAPYPKDRSPLTMTVPALTVKPPLNRGVDIVPGPAPQFKVPVPFFISPAPSFDAAVD